jgi:lipoprotein-anchoring transpeptidase ErfK/SrfK
MDKLYSDVLRAMYDLPGNHDAEDKLVNERLVPLGKALFFSKAKYPNDPSGLLDVHLVSSGENPDGIARSYGMSREMLNRLRGKDVNDASLRSGEALKVVKVKEAGGYHIDIDLSDYTLDLFIGGAFAKRYTIAHGAKESPTPVGTTALTDRVWHPQWTHPQTKKVMPYGDPENILGPIWLPFDGKQLGQSGIGIHGYTGADGRMQAQVSNGCIRMQNEDAEELFQLISHPQRAPTSVTIRR